MKARSLAIAAIAFLGMVDTLYLSLKRGTGPIPCRISGGCNDVLNSSYSAVGGIPLSSIGFAFYFFIFCVAIFANFGSDRLFGWIFWPALAAFAVSLVLVGIQAFVLHAYCEYCLVSAGFATSIFLISSWRVRLPPKSRVS